MKLRPPQSGSTLAVVLTVMAVLMVTAAIAFEYTSSTTRNAQRGATLQTAITIGDSALEVMFNSWRSTCRASTTIPKTSGLTTIATPSPFPSLRTTNFVKRGTGFDPADDSSYAANFLISNYKLVATTAEYTALPSANATPEPMIGQVSANLSSVSPTTSATYNYIASADVTLPQYLGTSTTSATSKNVVARVRRVFSKQQLSPWNWAIFYVDPLEIHPGAPFTVTGWVHTNSDLYTGHAFLNFADRVTYAGDWYYPNSAHPGYGFMPNDGVHTETPTSPTWLSTLAPGRDQEQQPFGLDTTSIFDITDTNPNNDGYHELIDPPNSSYSDPLVDDKGNPVRYFDQAGVIISVDASNTVTIGVYNGSGGVTNIAPPASGPDPRTNAQKNLYNMFNASGVITTNGSIQDNREGTPDMRTVTLDVSKLTAANGAVTNGVTWNIANQANFNGIVYIYDKSATTNRNPDGSINSSPVRRAIKVTNGSTLPITGLTIASPNPVYLQGDFNTGGTGSAVPSNNSANLNSDGTYKDPSNPPAPQVAGYTRAPSAIVADAVDVLSSSWLDTNAGTVPTAASTTVNTAIVSGNVPTNMYGDKGYSGGAENFPRFLENWSNKTFTYYGSMVELYQSNQAIGEWGKDNVYSPPTRAWYFDSNFKTSPPLGTIMIYNYIKGQWSVVSY